MSPPVAPAKSTALESPTPAPPAAVNRPTTDSATTVSSPKAVDRVTLALTRSSFQVGENLKLSAVAEAADGTPLSDRRIEWSSSAPGVARVTENGTLRALRPGQATIIATVDGRSTTTKIQVVSPATQPPAREPIAAMSVVPEAAPLAVGSTMTLSPVLRDGSGKRLEDRTIIWTSSSSAVSVFPNGQILAVGPGTAVVTASSEGRSANATITVSPVAVASLSLTGAPSDLNVGDSVRLNAAPHDPKGGVLANRQTTWESSDPNVATVSGGLVIARGPGTATISAASEGKSTTAKIRVSGPPPVDPAAEKARAVDQVGKGIAAFVAALNSRDMTRLRQAYPGMTPAEESDWSKLLNEESHQVRGRSRRSLQPSKPPRRRSSSSSGWHSPIQGFPLRPSGFGIREYSARMAGLEVDEAQPALAPRRKFQSFDKPLRACIGSGLSQEPACEHCRTASRRRRSDHWPDRFRVQR
jgi:uncharacterized protein YjdB